MMHIQDWLPTLMTAIRADENLDPTLDGRDVWDAINDPDAATYDELLLVIDNQRNLSALIMDKDNQTWKLSQGSLSDDKVPQYYLLAICNVTLYCVVGRFGACNFLHTFKII
jgi:hypothetical protein